MHAAGLILRNLVAAHFDSMRSFEGSLTASQNGAQDMAAKMTSIVQESRSRQQIVGSHAILWMDLSPALSNLEFFKEADTACAADRTHRFCADVP